MRPLYALALFVTAAIAAPLESVESGVYETPGTQAEIAARGKACIAQLVRNDAVQITGAAQTGLSIMLADPYSPNTNTQQIPGGPVIVSVDSSAVVANSRIAFKVMLNQWSVQSTLTLMAKDGRFKFRHSAILLLSRDTGLLHNAGYEPIDERAAIVKQVRSTLGQLDEKIAQCIRAPSVEW